MLKNLGRFIFRYLFDSKLKLSNIFAGNVTFYLFIFYLFIYFAVSGQFLNCEGSGLYALQSSCEYYYVEIPAVPLKLWTPSVNTEIL